MSRTDSVQVFEGDGEDPSRDPFFFALRGRRLVPYADDRWLANILRPALPTAGHEYNGEFFLDLDVAEYTTHVDPCLPLIHDDQFVYLPQLTINCPLGISSHVFMDVVLMEYEIRLHETPIHFYPERYRVCFMAQWRDFQRCE